MESRSIDLAKTASIDMMSLNNKVVNMRQVVKRTKVRVINKLCKNITALKKKKGTDEQRTKNLRKAERLIEEIESIKKLKEDKVSKYALANTSSFEETTKITVLPGPRALARLADHLLMKEVVLDFRKQHQDWRDLAAYLLVKQTGRRFKTKKQKQNKLAKSVENINASETMTKAYIQERFGKEGLSKAEQRFERKRKRQPFTPKSDVQESDMEENSEKKKPKVVHEIGTTNEVISEVIGTISFPEPVTEEVKNKGHSEKDSKQAHKVITKGEKINSSKVDIESESCNLEGNIDRDGEDKRLSLQMASDSKSNNTSEGSEGHFGSKKDSLNTSKKHTAKLKHSETNKKNEVAFKKVSGDTGSASKTEEESDADKSTESGKSVDESTEVTRTENDKKQQKKVGSKSECVVKTLNIGEQSNDKIIGSDSASDDESDNGNVSQNEASGNSEEEWNDDSESSDNRIEPLKNRKKKEKRIPAFLMESTKKVISDPFFAGSDDDDNDDSSFDDKEIENVHSNYEGASDDDSSFNQFKIGSMFHNPDEEGQGGPRKSRFQREGSKGIFGRRGGSHHLDKPHSSRGGPWDFDKSQRDIASFRGNKRGRGTYRNFEDRRGRIFDSGPSKYGRRNDRMKTFSAEVSFSKNRASGAGLNKTESVAAGSQESEDKLHPSWEASKKRKAEQSGIAAFKGSKITFADD